MNPVAGAGAVGGPNGVSPVSGASPVGSDGVGEDGGGFAQALADALGNVNQTMATADRLAASYAAGGPVTLDQLMIAEQQASLALSLVVQVRDRVVNAYQTIMNMQV
ncbi:flagellar hook-basal body complex protein FliE [Alicyclobacillus sp.]|uniref:flagellar hook-basal body complex protein FliE n=1 Tax=Alicyclobacillus sp. TaxID=61169 RepID=UPI0025C3D53F|nr:flagellar hook-basal body complex protein FliE [Alicyclobacillus sp.]MCL6515641.1 flagellar hook-basal body complex protein FliE [Alicyclobacillus sp.]